MATALHLPSPEPPKALAPPAPPFHLSEAWARCWADAYGSGTPILVPAGETRLRMELRGCALGPLRFPLLASPTNLQTCYFDLDGDASPEELDALPERLLAGGAAQVRIDWLAESARLLGAGRRWQSRHLVTVDPFAVSPLVDCRTPIEAYLARAGSTVRKIWKSCRRQVLDGPLDFAIVTGGPGLEGLLDEMFALEAAGWKGRAGHAILCNEADRRFYAALARAAAEARALRIATLRDGPRLLAYEYCVVSGDTVLAMKVAYDESRGRLRPGHMAALLNIADACADPRLGWYDLLGNGMRIADYKRRFATDYRSLYRIRLFARSPVGRLLYGAFRARSLARAMRDAVRKLRTPAA